MSCRGTSGGEETKRKNSGEVDLDIEALAQELSRLSLDDTKLDSTQLGSSNVVVDFSQQQQQEVQQQQPQSVFSTAPADHRATGYVLENSIIFNDRRVDLNLEWIGGVGISSVLKAPVSRIDP
ncbi:uncharacterized protein N7511_001944 [Penicillium nucicola]|uniref:uncharacterized protein n=1 Tax=Penicillium nucicola TaxID=1850975 RepID=UPI002544D4D4|nr:uncharacterized protein N7511_001944 [Penicillium nucicola]KAJ5769893.1 hypothetical protein N7511_001944 [Penicillium nucicola]